MFVLLPESAFYNPRIKAFQRGIDRIPNYMALIGVTLDVELKW